MRFLRGVRDVAPDHSRQIKTSRWRRSAKWFQKPSFFSFTSKLELNYFYRSIDRYKTSAFYLGLAYCLNELVKRLYVLRIIYGIGLTKYGILISVRSSFFFWKAYEIQGELLDPTYNTTNNPVYNLLFMPPFKCWDFQRARVKNEGNVLWQSNLRKDGRSNPETIIFDLFSSVTPSKVIHACFPGTVETMPSPFEIEPRSCPQLKRLPAAVILPSVWVKALKSSNHIGFLLRLKWTPSYYMSRLSRLMAYLFCLFWNFGPKWPRVTFDADMHSAYPSFKEAKHLSTTHVW